MHIQRMQLNSQGRVLLRPEKALKDPKKRFFPYFIHTGWVPMENSQFDFLL